VSALLAERHRRSSSGVGPVTSISSHHDDRDNDDDDDGMYASDYSVDAGRPIRLVNPYEPSTVTVASTVFF